MTAARHRGGSRWRARPWLAAALTAGVVTVPLVLSRVVTLALGSLVAGLPWGSRVLVLGAVAVSVLLRVHI